MVLDSIEGVLGEQCRLYRMTVNGHLKPGEMCKMMFGLREIRTSVESLQSPAPAPAPTAEFNICAVPTSHYIKRVEELPDSGSRLAIEHRQVEKIERIEPDSIRDSMLENIDRVQSEAEIISDLRREINALAKKTGVDLVV